MDLPKKQDKKKGCQRYTHKFLPDVLEYSIFIANMSFGESRITNPEQIQS